jgi:phosphoenolpyruvate carboxykinase (ATP)
MLQPASAWQDADAYQVKARELAQLFQENFRHLADEAGPDISNAGPVIS